MPSVVFKELEPFLQVLLISLGVIAVVSIILLCSLGLGIYLLFLLF